MKTNGYLNVVVLFTVLTVLLVLPVRAKQAGGSPLADQTWVRLGGPPGGIGYDIKVNPDNPDIMYVTDVSAGIHKSEDGGLNWMNFNQGIDVHTGASGDAVPVFSVTVDPNDSNIVWIGLIDRKGIYRSIDGGKTWERRTHGIQEENGLSIRGITIEPGNSNIVYAAGELSSWAWAGEGINGQIFDMVKGVIYKSQDGGLSWTAIWRGENLARYVIIDPENVNILYISTGIFDREAANSDYASNNAGGEGILKSYDGGKTWQPINTGLQSLYIGSLAMHPSDSQILLAGAGNNVYSEGSGIYLSTNGGDVWQLVGGSSMVVSVADFSPSNPSVLYAAGEMAFMRSDDGGITWKEYRNATMGFGWGPPGITPGFPIDIQVDPRSPYRVFVNNYAGGNLLSEDGGETWINASNGYTGEQVTNLAVDPNNPAIIYSNGKGGVFKSVDGGMNWTGILPVEMMGDARLGEVEINPIDSNIVYASNVNGSLYVSNDGGNMWSKIFGFGREMEDMYQDTPRLSFQGVSRIVFAPSDSSHAYAGFGLSFYCTQVFEEAVCLESTYKNMSLLVSNDGGTTWNIIEGTEISGMTVADVVIHPENPDIVWVTSPWHGIYKSLNGGLDWKQTSSGLNLNAFSMAINPQNPDMLFAGALNDGIYISIDGGETWKKSSSGMEPNETVNSIVVDPSKPDVIYAGGGRSGVYLSENQGKSWRLINNGLSTRAVYTLEISPDGSTLYAGTHGEGVFRLSTHDQDYFNALMPTPTPIPPTATPLPASTTIPPAVSPSPSSPSKPVLPCGSALLLPLFIFGFAWLLRHK